jgi:hypothetical protein
MPLIRAVGIFNASMYHEMNLHVCIEMGADRVEGACVCAHRVA